MSDPVFKEIEIKKDFHYEGAPSIGSLGLRTVFHEDRIFNVLYGFSEDPTQLVKCSAHTETQVYSTGSEIRSKTDMILTVFLEIKGEPVELHLNITGDIQLTESLNESVKKIILGGNKVV